MSPPFHCIKAVVQLILNYLESFSNSQNQPVLIQTQVGPANHVSTCHSKSDMPLTSCQQMLCIIQMTILVKESSFYMIFTSWHCTPCFRPSWFQRPAPAWFNMPLALFTGTRMRTINSKPVYLTVSFLDNHILLYSNTC